MRIGNRALDNFNGLGVPGIISVSWMLPPFPSSVVVMMIEPT